MTFRLSRVLSLSGPGAVFSGLLVATASASLATMSCEGLTCSELQNCEEGGASSTGGGSGGAETGGRSTSGGAAGSSTGGSSAGAPSGGRSSASGGEGGAVGEGSGGEGVVEAPGIALDVPKLLRVRQGTKVNFEVQVERQGSLKGTITLKLSGLPNGVVSDVVELAEGEEVAEFEVAATSESEQTISEDVTVVAEGPEGLKESAMTRLIVAGAPGSLDESFGNGGVLWEAAEVSYVTVAEDESIWISGKDDGGILRLYRFERNGEASWNIEVDGRGWTDLLAQGDRVFARYTGAAEGEDALLAFDLDGTPSAGFGEEGSVDFGLGYVGIGDRVTAAPDGGFLVANSDGTFRINTDGTPTANFAYFYEHESNEDRPSALAFDPKGRVLGSSRAADSTRYFMTRARADGRLDSSFGAYGVAESLTGLPSETPDQYMEPTRILARPDGSSVLVAASVPRTEPFDIDAELAVLSFGADGSLDEEFGSDGKVVLAPLGRQYDAFRAATGEILVLYAPGLGGYHWLGRYSDRGVLDLSFGEAGVVQLESLLGATESPVDRSDVAEDAGVGRVIAVVPGSERSYIASYWL